MTALAAVARLRRLVASADAGEPLAAEAVTALAAGLRTYLDQAPTGVTLEQALGLATPPGGTPWWRAERVAARDAVLRDLAAGFAGPVATRAQALALLPRRYAATGWPHDRRRGEPFPCTPERDRLFRLFCLDPDPPTSIRRLSDIIASLPPVLVPDAAITPFLLRPVPATVGPGP
jgi:hypothetical protein